LSFFDELRRRNVIRMAGLYLVGAWLIVQVVSTILPAFDFPGWALRAVITLLAVGFVPALVFAWAFELTPEGLKREKDVDRAESIKPYARKTLDRIIMVVLALALGYFAFDKFVLSPARERSVVESARLEGRGEALVESYGDKSIAVLPFVNMSADRDQEYFADGIAEELLNVLTKVPHLRVISRSSAFSFKGKNVGIPEIGRRLNVAHVLEGSVRKSGNQVRITAQLIDARSDTHLWSQTYDRPLDDIFAVQDEIATSVVAQLKMELLGSALTAKVADPKAYSLYLQARHLGRQGTAGAQERSIALYRQALAIDPKYASAWAGLAQDYRIQSSSGLHPEGIATAREAVDKALAIDPANAMAHAELGWIALVYDGDLAAAAQHFQRALSLEPANTDVLRGAGHMAGALGRLDTAIALDEFVTASDPVNPVAFNNLANMYVFGRRLDDAITNYRTALSLSPDYAGAHYSIGVALLLKGDRAGALAAMREESDVTWRAIGLPMAWHALGRRAESDAALAELISKHEKEASYNIAYVLAFLGKADDAFEWLGKAVAYHDPGLMEIAVEPLFAAIHDDPRWLPCLRKLGRAPDQLAAIKFDVKLRQ
jgi:TolB-like protein/Tfp pilus assembly protein PilF